MGDEVFCQRTGHWISAAEADKSSPTGDDDQLVALDTSKEMSQQPQEDVQIPRQEEVQFAAEILGISFRAAKALACKRIRDAMQQGVGVDVSKTSFKQEESDNDSSKKKENYVKREYDQMDRSPLETATEKKGVPSTGGSRDRERRSRSITPCRVKVEPHQHARDTEHKRQPLRDNDRNSVSPSESKHRRTDRSRSKSPSKGRHAPGKKMRPNISKSRSPLKHTRSQSKSPLRNKASSTLGSQSKTILRSRNAKSPIPTCRSQSPLSNKNAEILKPRPERFLNKSLKMSRNAAMNKSRPKKSPSRSPSRSKSRNAENTTSRQLMSVSQSSVCSTNAETLSFGPELPLRTDILGGKKKSRPLRSAEIAASPKYRVRRCASKSPIKKMNTVDTKFKLLKSPNKSHVKGRHESSQESTHSRSPSGSSFEGRNVSSSKYRPERASNKGVLRKRISASPKSRNKRTFSRSPNRIRTAEGRLDTSTNNRSRKTNFLSGNNSKAHKQIAPKITQIRSLSKDRLQRRRSRRSRNMSFSSNSPDPNSKSPKQSRSRSLLRDKLRTKRKQRSRSGSFSSNSFKTGPKYIPKRSPSKSPARHRHVVSPKCRSKISSRKIHPRNRRNVSPEQQPKRLPNRSPLHGRYQASPKYSCRSSANRSVSRGRPRQSNQFRYRRSKSGSFSSNSSRSSSLNNFRPLSRSPLRKRHRRSISGDERFSSASQGSSPEYKPRRSRGRIKKVSRDEIRPRSNSSTCSTYSSNDDSLGWDSPVYDNGIFRRSSSRDRSSGVNQKYSPRFRSESFSSSDISVSDIEYNPRHSQSISFSRKRKEVVYRRSSRSKSISKGRLGPRSVSRYKKSPSGRSSRERLRSRKLSSSSSLKTRYRPRKSQSTSPLRDSHEASRAHRSRHSKSRSPSRYESTAFLKSRETPSGSTYREHRIATSSYKSKSNVNQNKCKSEHIELGIKSIRQNADKLKTVVNVKQEIASTNRDSSENCKGILSHSSTRSSGRTNENNPFMQTVVIKKESHLQQRPIHLSKQNTDEAQLTQTESCESTTHSMKSTIKALNTSDTVKKGTQEKLAQTLHRLQQLEKQQQLQNDDLWEMRIALEKKRKTKEGADMHRPTKMEEEQPGFILTAHHQKQINLGSVCDTQQYTPVNQNSMLVQYAAPTVLQQPEQSIDMSYDEATTPGGVGQLGTAGQLGNDQPINVGPVQGVGHSQMGLAAWQQQVQQSMPVGHPGMYVQPGEELPQGMMLWKGAGPQQVQQQYMYQQQGNGQWQAGSEHTIPLVAAVQSQMQVAPPVNIAQQFDPCAQSFVVDTHASHSPSSAIISPPLTPSTLDPFTSPASSHSINATPVCVFSAAPRSGSIQNLASASGTYKNIEETQKQAIECVRMPKSSKGHNLSGEVSASFTQKANTTCVSSIKTVDRNQISSPSPDLTVRSSTSDASRMANDTVSPTASSSQTSETSREIQHRIRDTEKAASSSKSNGSDNESAVLTTKHVGKKPVASNSYQLHISRLGNDIATEDLVKHFEVYGKITDLHRFVGYAFITFNSESAVEQAITGGWVRGQEDTSVHWIRKDRSIECTRCRQFKGSLRNCQVFLSDMSKLTSPKVLQKYFCKYGEIMASKKVNKINCLVITFSHPSSVDKVMVVGKVIGHEGQSWHLVAGRYISCQRNRNAKQQRHLDELKSNSVDRDNHDEDVTIKEQANEDSDEKDPYCYYCSTTTHSLQNCAYLNEQRNKLIKRITKDDQLQVLNDPHKMLTSSKQKPLEKHLSKSPIETSKSVKRSTNENRKDEPPIKTRRCKYFRKWKHNEDKCVLCQNLRLPSDGKVTTGQKKQVTAKNTATPVDNTIACCESVPSDINLKEDSMMVMPENLVKSGAENALGNNNDHERLWIIGDVILLAAKERAKVTQKEKFGMPPNTEVSWFCTKGASLMHFHTSFCKLLRNKQPPTFAVIHLGLNDMNTFDENVNFENITKALDTIQELTPNCVVLWSEILSTFGFQNGRPKEMLAQKRRKLNHHAFSQISKLPNVFGLRHTFDYYKLFSKSDLLRLSIMGLDKLLRTFRAALQNYVTNNCIKLKKSRSNLQTCTSKGKQLTSSKPGERTTASIANKGKCEQKQTDYVSSVLSKDSGEKTIDNVVKKVCEERQPTTDVPFITDSIKTSQSKDFVGKETEDKVVKNTGQQTCSTNIVSVLDSVSSVLSTDSEVKEIQIKVTNSTCLQRLPTTDMVSATDSVKRVQSKDAHVCTNSQDKATGHQQRQSAIVMPSVGSILCKDSVGKEIQVKVEKTTSQKRQSTTDVQRCGSSPENGEVIAANRGQDIHQVPGDFLSEDEDDYLIDVSDLEKISTQGLSQQTTETTRM